MKSEHINELTQKELKKHLHYNPITGIFTRLSSSRGLRIKGVESGCLDVTTGYRRIMVNKKKMSAHRLAFLYMTGIIPKEVDHINHIRDDNSWINLRSVTHRENTMNASTKTPLKTKGVSYNKALKKWHSRIRVNNELKHLGFHKDKRVAVLIRKAAECWYGFHKNHGDAL